MNGQDQKEEQLTLELLDAIGKNSDVSQRHLASEMGVALGLANSYLKRCIRKGLVKISSAPANRYLYYLTPKGFTEKGRLTAKYLAYSFSFYRQASDSCRRVFKQCQSQGYRRVMLCGVSDLAEIASLRSIECDIKIKAIYDPEYPEDTFLDIAVSKKIDDVKVDAYILTDCQDSAGRYRNILNLVDKEKIFVPDVLRLE